MRWFGPKFNALWKNFSKCVIFSKCVATVQCRHDCPRIRGTGVRYNNIFDHRLRSWIDCDDGPLLFSCPSHLQTVRFKSWYDIHHIHSYTVFQRKMSKLTKCVDDKMYQSSIHILYFTWINFHLFYSWTIFKLGRLIDFLLLNVRLEIISIYGSRHYHCEWNVGLWLTYMVIQHQDK